MNKVHTEQQSANGSVVHSTEHTRLSGAFLLFVRAVWLALVTPSLGLFVAGLPVYYAQLQRACVDPITCNVALALTAKGLRAFAELGFSASGYAAFATIFWAIIVAIWSGVGILIFWRRSDDWLALLAAFALVMFNITYPGLPAYELSIAYPALDVATTLMSTLGLVSIGVFFLLFPGGWLVPRWMGLIVPLVIIQAVSTTVPLASPFNSNNWPGWLNALLALTIYGSIIFSQIYRYRRASTPVERQQTKWVVFGIITIGTGFIVFGLLSSLFPVLTQPDTPYALFQIAYPLLLLFLPLSIGMAIIRYRLWDIDLIIKRTLVYGTLTAFVVGFYVLVVGYLGAVFHTGGNLLISLIATGLVAVLFQPLREVLQRGVNRLFYGQRDEPYAVITGLSQRLEATLAPDAVLPTIVETVAQALKLPYAAIFLKQEESLSVAASYGHFRVDPLILPLIYHAETIGELHIAPRTPGEPFTSADLRLLDELARHAGLAAHAICLTTDLQRSRERLVTTREEERRRLRRDLHDGLGSALSSVIFKLDATDELLDRDPARAKALLAEARAQMQASISDIRRFVYNLRPPILDEWGLLAALREHVAQYELKNVQVSFQIPESLPAISAAVEVAIYRIALEALANVTKHAQATACTIRLVLLADMLTLVVEDDGVGRPAGSHAGVGLTAMRERAAELGGSCIVEDSVPHGTRVCACFPV